MGKTMSAERLNREPEILSKREASPCPFCGAPAQIQFWHGGGPNKRLVGCSGQADTLMRGNRPIECHAAPAVIGGNKAVALARWNARAKTK